jgi:hypothetical protein
VPSNSRINVGKERFGLVQELCEVLDEPDYSRSISGQVWNFSGQTSPGLGLTSLGWHFQLNLDDCFGHILLTECLIDFILFPLCL